MSGLFVGNLPALWRPEVVELRLYIEFEQFGFPIRNVHCVPKDTDAKQNKGFAFINLQEEVPVTVLEELVLRTHKAIVLGNRHVTVQIQRTRLSLAAQGSPKARPGEQTVCTLAWLLLYMTMAARRPISTPEVNHAFAILQQARGEVPTHVLTPALHTAVHAHLSESIWSWQDAEGTTWFSRKESLLCK